MSTLWQVFFGWLRGAAAWLNEDAHETILVTALAVVLIYLVFKRRG